MTTVARRLGGIVDTPVDDRRSAAAGPDRGRRAEARHIQALMQEAGMFADMNRTLELQMPQVIGNLKKIHPDIPQAAWDDLARLSTEEFKKSLPEFEEPVIAILDKNFTESNS